jgi:phosphonate transport system substrate-binding protein
MSLIAKGRLASLRRRQAQSRRLRVTILLAVACTWLAPAGIGEERSSLVVGLIPEMNVFEQVDRFRLLAEFLSQRVGQDVELSMLSRYGNIVERIVGKEVDAAFLGSFTGALASAQLGMQPVARPINLDGSSTYWGYVFVRRESGIENVDQMRGLRLALVEKATTAGYVFPVAYFRGQGVDEIEEFFGEVQFWGSHDASINAVLDGRADVGAAKNTIWEHLAGENPRLTEELRILATSPQVPSNGLFLAAEVDPLVREIIRSTLLTLHEEPEGTAVLERLRARGFVPTDIESYQPVFELARAAGIDIGSYTYNNQ